MSRDESTHSPFSIEFFDDGRSNPYIVFGPMPDGGTGPYIHVMDRHIAVEVAQILSRAYFAGRLDAVSS